MRPLFLLASTLAFAACGGSMLPVAPTTRMDATALASTRGRATSLVGSWHGTFTFEQTIDGARQSALVQSGLEIGADALPAQLPGLGFVGPWNSYAAGASGAEVNGVNSRISDGHAGSIFVFCTTEVDGPANSVVLDPVSAIATEETFAWRYGAQYRFADLTTYSLYDYTEPSAPSASLSASESYALDGERLRVQATAEGTDSSGRDLTLKLTGLLERGAAAAVGPCKL